jgi:uncharacterized membrane protein YdbT with pleckstrin-like domain
MRVSKNTELPPIIIRKSIAVFAIRVIVLELVFEIIYLSWRTLIHYLPFSLETVLTLNAASIIIFFILVTVIQNIFLLYITLNWVNDYYEFRTKDIAQFKGILGRTKQSYQYRDIQSITIKQSVFGRLFNYGDVILYIPMLGQSIHFSEVPDPKKFVSFLKSLQPETESPRVIMQRQKI